VCVIDFRLASFTIRCRWGTTISGPFCAAPPPPVSGIWLPASTTKLLLVFCSLLNHAGTVWERNSQWRLWEFDSADMNCYLPCVCPAVDAENPDRVPRIRASGTQGWLLGAGFRNSFAFANGPSLRCGNTVLPTFSAFKSWLPVAPAFVYFRAYIWFALTRALYPTPSTAWFWWVNFWSSDLFRLSWSFLSWPVLRRAGAIHALDIHWGVKLFGCPGMGVRHDSLKAVQLLEERMMPEQPDH
jgi:hypothetical protein